MKRPSLVPRRWRSRPSLLAHLLLGAIAYVPLLFTARGQVGADTKSYLYLDPDRLLARAASMWDPNIGMGTVTHQNIGYLWPMGPFFWVFEHLGVPDWLAQRIWLGSILFAAGAGVLFLCRTLRVPLRAALPAALVFMLTPYSLALEARLSALLLPWAALPWMIGIVVRALRKGGWRYPAIFALVVVTVGGVNATALLYAGIGPVLWFPYAVWVLREVPFRRAAATFAKIGGLTLVTALWWIAGLSLQAGYGIDVLRYTETVRTVASTSLASEVLRGLGYWFFYGRDKLGPWIEPAFYYTQWVWLIVVSFTIPLLAFVSAFLTRWRHRGYFVVLVLVGATVAVGVHPYDDPSPFGSVLKDAATGSSAGLAMRSSARAVPLVALGIAMLLGGGIAALLGRVRRYGNLAAVLVAVLAIVNVPPLFGGKMVARDLRRPEAIPAYWNDVARYLDGRGDASRVLEIPGADFASYRWGNTVDPVTPGISDRPFVARELIPYGTPGSSDLLNALDRRLQEGVFEPAALAPLARLMGVGDVVVRNDLQFERFNLVRPRPLWRVLTDPLLPGFGTPRAFGPRGPNVPSTFPMLDEIALALPPGAPDPPPVAVLPVQGGPTIVRAERAEQPLLMAGDAEGVVDAAASGLLRPGVPVLYSASMAGHPDQLRDALDAGADLLLTDSNRRRARRWNTVRDNRGYTEEAGERPLRDDTSDARLPLFPDAGDDTRTVAVQRGVKSVRATSYGNPITYTPEDRPVLAVDGDPRTAWKIGAYGDPVGEFLRIELERPVRTDHLSLTRLLGGPYNRFVTRVTLRFDTGDPVTVDLTADADRPEGQRIDFRSRRFSRVDVIVAATNIGGRGTLPGKGRDTFGGLSSVGFADVAIDGVRASETVRLPTDLLEAAGAEVDAHRLTILLDRERSQQIPPRGDDESFMSRTFTLPTERTFTLRGTARVSAFADDDVVARSLGDPVLTTSTGRLSGDLASRPYAAVDGDPRTAWRTFFGTPDPTAIDVPLGGTRTIDRLRLLVVADGRHSIPTKVRVEAGGVVREIDLPEIREGTDEGHTASVPITFPAVTGDVLRLGIVGTRRVDTLNWYSEGPITLPAAIAELGIPGFAPQAASSELPGACRSDLLTVDGFPVEVRVAGTRTDGERRRGLVLQSCEDELLLGSGEHEIRTAAGRDAGIDIDRLVLDSAAADPAGGPPPAAPPRVRVVDEGRTAMTVRATAPDGPFWLVLGQSHSPGWRATVGGRSLGPPRLVDGYANGWLVPDGGGGRDVEIRLQWTPQRRVWVALVLSGAGVLACVALIVLAPGRRRRRALDDEVDASTLRVPWEVRASGRPRAVVVSALAVLAAATVVAGPVVGVVTAALAVGAMLRSRLRAVVAFVAVSAVAVAGAYTAIGQFRYRYLPQLEWPTRFPFAHDVAWLAICLLAADVVVNGVIARRPRASRSGPD